MRFETDVQRGRVQLALPKSQYSLDGIRIAVHVFDSRAEAALDESRSGWRLTLTARRKSAKADDLERLAGEFLNELLNQEYRFVVGRFNRKIADLTVMQALFSARGGENPPAPPPEESAPEFAAEVEKLMRETREEIARTMPPKIAPQGSPLPPAAEGVNA